MGPVMLPGDESGPLGLGPGTMTVLVSAGPVGNSEVSAGRVLTFDEPDTPDGDGAEPEPVVGIGSEGLGETRLTEWPTDGEAPVGKTEVWIEGMWALPDSETPGS